MAVEADEEVARIGAIRVAVWGDADDLRRHAETLRRGPGADGEDGIADALATLGLKETDA